MLNFLTDLKQKPASKSTNALLLHLVSKPDHFRQVGFNTFLQLQLWETTEPDPVEIIAQPQLHAVAFLPKARRTRALLCGFCRVRPKPSFSFGDVRNIWRLQPRGRPSNAIKCLSAPPQPTERAHPRLTNAEMLFIARGVHMPGCARGFRAARSIGSRCSVKT